MKPGISFAHGLVVVLVVALLGIYFWLFAAGIEETQDASIVESVQVSLQATSSKGAATLQVPPAQIHPLNVVNAAKSSFPKGVRVDEKLNLVIQKTDRGAQYQITDRGDLVIVSLKNFTRYHIEAGRIVRNNQ